MVVEVEVIIMLLLHIMQIVVLFSVHIMKNLLRVIMVISSKIWCVIVTTNMDIVIVSVVKV